MSIPKEFIHRLVERADLAEIVGAHVKLQRRGDNYFGLCPFHNEKTPSFSVNANKGFYHCFGCGAHGNAISFLSHYNGGDFIAAVEALAGILGVAVPRDGRQYEKEDDFRGVLRQALDYWRRQLRESEEARAYLKKRGISGETAARYELGYAKDDWQGLLNAASSIDKKRLLAAGLAREKEGKIYDYFRHRLIFPILEANNRVCAFGGRALRDDDQPKYLNSAESATFSKRRVLYGLPQAAAAAREKKRLIVCEGYMDVVMLAQAGFSEAVATMGTAATPEQMKKAVRLASSVIFAFDADSAGQKAALRGLEGVLPALKDGIGVFFLSLPDGDDPDSYIRKNGAAAFEQRIAAARPLDDYMAAALWQNSGGGSEEARASGMMREGERLLRLLSVQDAPYLRQWLTEKLAQRAQMTTTTMEQALSRPQRTTPQSKLRMPPTDKLFNLLCCLTAEPALAAKLPYDLPLPGATAQDAEVVAVVLAALNWNMDEEPPGVPSLLEEKGYAALAAQVADAAKRRFLAATDVGAEFDLLLAKLRRAHDRLTGVGKKNWKEEIEKGIAGTTTT